MIDDEKHSWKGYGLPDQPAMIGVEMVQRVLFMDPRHSYVDKEFSKTNQEESCDPLSMQIVVF